jgi:tetratricopeptide (TPR) repeat protein
MEDYPGALAECEAAIVLAPGEGRLYFDRAQCRSQLEAEPEGLHEDSLADYERALEVGHREPDVFLAKAITLQDLEALDLAVAALDAGLAEHPEAAELLYFRGTFKGALGDDDEGADAGLARAESLGFVAPV